MTRTVPSRLRRCILGALTVLPVFPKEVLGQGAGEQASGMKIRLSFENQSFTATLDDNVSARDFFTMLPLDLTVSDFGGNEKIAYLPRKLDDGARGPFADPAPGDICCYLPWGNLAFFHGKYESSADLARLGRLDNGIDPLLVRGEFPLRIERVG